MSQLYTASQPVSQSASGCARGRKTYREAPQPYLSVLVQGGREYLCVSDGAVAVTSANNPKTHPAITKLQVQKINRCDTAAGLTDKEIAVGYRDTLGLKGVDWKFYSYMCPLP